MINCLILGAGGAVPTPSHGPAAYWISVDTTSILLDPGPGALVRLIKSAHGPDSLDAIETVLLSHLHLDHCADLAPLLFALHSPVLQSRAPLRLIGPPGLATYLERLGDLYGSWLTPHQRTLEVEEVVPGQSLHLPGGGGNDSGNNAGDGSGNVEPVNNCHIECYAADHPQDRFAHDCLCLRFRDGEGHSLTFSGDTAPCAGLTEASRDTDLLVVECSTSDAFAMKGHMSPARVAELCRDAQPRRVVLTHLYPAALAVDLAAEIGRVYTGPLTIARDDTLYRVPSSEDAP